MGYYSSKIAIAKLDCKKGAEILEGLRQLLECARSSCILSWSIKVSYHLLWLTATLPHHLLEPGIFCVDLQSLKG